MEVNKKSNLDPNEEIFLLVNRAKKGDELAFKDLMNKFNRAVYFLIYKMVKNDADAEDLTIEVFSKVFFNLDMYAETHSFSTWLFKIASNHAIDFLRRKKNKQRPVNIDEPVNEETNWFIELESDEPNPERQMIIKQHEQDIRKLIDILPEDIRTVIILRVFEELSYKEIADKIDQPIGTVKARLYRGRNLLTTILRKKMNY
ncbi:MAG: sigma-70 family RNA polymerase sigma factor [Bacteroidales bacterium]|nr:sigma-70 family RNA polymerase sigma factor [Bacteroidales bacterium]